jgi:plastocyanin
MRRRTLLRTVAGTSLAGVAGCSGDGSNDGGDGGDGAAEQNEVAVAPGGSLAFQPETIVVSPGTTVTWTFESATHNVSCNPEHHDAASLPDGAEPFASYEADERFATNDEGETFEHTFEVAGTYDYVCVPHAGSGMVGTVEVE